MNNKCGKCHFLKFVELFITLKQSNTSGATVVILTRNGTVQNLKVSMRCPKNITMQLYSYICYT